MILKSRYRREWIRVGVKRLVIRVSICTVRYRAFESDTSDAGFLRARNLSRHYGKIKDLPDGDISPGGLFIIPLLVANAATLSDGLRKERYVAGGDYSLSIPGAKTP